MSVHDPRDLPLNKSFRKWLNSWLSVAPEWLGLVLLGPDRPGYRHQLDFEAYLLGMLQGASLVSSYVPWMGTVELAQSSLHYTKWLKELQPLEKVVTISDDCGVYNTAAVPYWYHPDDLVFREVIFVPMRIFDSYSVELFIAGLSTRVQLPHTRVSPGLGIMCALSQGFSTDQINRIDELLVGNEARRAMRMLTGQEWEDLPRWITKGGLRKAGESFYEWALESLNVAESTRVHATWKMAHSLNSRFVSTISSKVLVAKLKSLSRKVMNFSWLQRLSRRPAILDNPDEIVPMLPLVFDEDWQKMIPPLVGRTDLVNKLRQCTPTSIMCLPRIMNLRSTTCHAY